MSERKKGHHRKKKQDSDSSDDPTLEIKYQKQLKYQESRLQDRLKIQTENSVKEDTTTDLEQNTESSSSELFEDFTLRQNSIPSIIELPVSDIDEILAQNADQYFIKIRNESYLQAIWTSTEEIRSHMNGEQVLECLRPYISRKGPPYFNIDFTKPEIIVRVESDMCFLKWNSLGFKFCTWEPLNAYTKYYKYPNNNFNTDLVKPLWYFGLNEKYHKAVDNLATEINNSQNIILSGTIGSILRLQLYSLIYYITQTKSSGPFLFVVENRLIQLIEAEIRSKFNLSLLVIANSDEDEINMIKENVFIELQFNFILISYELLKEFETQLNQYEFTLAAIDMSEILGRTSIPSLEIDFGIQIRAKTKIALGPSFSGQSGKVIQSNISQNIEEFTWIISPSTDMVKKYTEVPTAEFFEHKPGPKSNIWASQFNTITNILSNDSIKHWTNSLLKICETVSRANQITTILQSITQQNTKIGCLLNFLSTKKKSLVLTDSNEISGLIAAFMQASGVFCQRILNDLNSAILSISNENPSFVVISSPNTKIDVTKCEIENIILFDSYNAEIIADNHIYLIKCVVQSSDDIIKCATKGNLESNLICSYVSRFLWRPIRETPQLDYTFISPNVFASSGRIEFPDENLIDGTMQSDLFIHSVPTFYIPKIKENPENVKFIEILEDDVTTDSVNEIFTNVQKYCYGNWNLFTRGNMNEKFAKTLVHAVLIAMMKISDVKLPLLANFLYKDNLYIPKSSMSKIIEIISANKVSEVRKALILAEKLLIVACCASQTDNAAGVFVAFSPSFLPTQWWSEIDDKLLLYRCWIHGIARMKVSEASDWSVKERLDSKTLFKRIKAVTAQIRKHPEQIVVIQSVPRPARNPTKVTTKHSILIFFVRQILDFGEFDFDELLQEPQLSNWTNEELSQFGQKLMSTIDGYNTLDISQKVLTNLRKSVELFKMAREMDVFNMFCDDRIILETVLLHGITQAAKSSCMPALLGVDNPSRKLVQQKFEEIVRSAIFPSPDDFVPKISETPIPAGIDTLVLSLGKVDTRQGFSSPSYIYPVGLSVTTSLCGEPIACEVREDRGSPLFVVRRESTQEEFIGQSPDDAVKAFVASTAPQCLGLLRRTPGHEVFGLCSVDVLRSIQSMRNADKCPKYRPRFFNEKTQERNGPKIFGRWRYSDKKVDNLDTLDKNVLQSISISTKPIRNLDVFDWTRILDNVDP